MHRLAAPFAIAFALSACGESAAPPAAAPAAPSVSRETPEPPPPRVHWEIEPIYGAEVRSDMWLWSQGDRLVAVYSTVFGAEVRVRSQGRWTGRELSFYAGAASLGPDASVALLGAEGDDDFGIRTARLRDTELVLEAPVAPRAAEVSAFVVDLRGAYHACFHDLVLEGDGSAGSGELRYATNRSGRWAQTRVGDGSLGACSMAVAPDGRVHLVALGQDGAHLFEADPSLREIRVVPGVHGRSFVGFDPRGRVQLVFRSLRDGIRLAHCVVDGDAPAVQTGSATLSTGSGGGDPLAVIFDGEGRPHAAYRDDQYRLGYATLDDGAWREEPIEAHSPVGEVSSIALAGGEPAILFTVRGTHVVLARRLAPAPCAPGQELMGAVCCWPGQRAQGDRCEGTPRCPEGSIQQGDEPTCTELPPDVRWDMAACRRRSLYGDDAAEFESCRRLVQTFPRALADFEARCRAGDGASCVAADAMLRGVLDYGVSLRARPCDDGFCVAPLVRRPRPGGALYGQDPLARELLETGCRAGHLDACEAVAAEDGPDAAVLFERACRGGRIHACAWIAAQSTSDDELKTIAHRHIAAACERGDCDACANRGVLQLMGWGTPPDVPQAAETSFAACACEDAQHARVQSCVQLVHIAERHPEAVSASRFRSVRAAERIDSGCFNHYSDACAARERAAELGLAPRRR
jgi:hypothetical protein